MLYRHKQGTFEVCPYKATYTALVKQVVEDGEIEIDGEMVMQYKQIEVEETREAFVYDKAQFEQTLSNSSEGYKDLVYEDFNLTPEQQERYEQIRSLPESSICACVEFILNGTVPRELEIQYLGKMVSDLEIQLLELQLGGS